MASQMDCRDSFGAQERIDRVIRAAAVALTASLLSRLNALTMSVLDTTPNATPSASQTTTSGVTGFDSMTAISRIDASVPSTASRRCASSMMC